MFLQLCLGYPTHLDPHNGKPCEMVRYLPGIPPGMFRIDFEYMTRGFQKKITGEN